MSAGKSVKFEISFKELSVKFEGDLPSAERMHGEFAGALTSIASAQRVLTAPPKPPPMPAIVTVEAPSRRRSGRRRRATVTDAAEAANGDVVGVFEPDASADDGYSARRAEPGAQSLVTVLKDEGYFSTKRTNADILGALAAKGHT